MADLLGTYSPEEVQVILSKDDFVHVVSGFADGTFIDVERITPASELYVGADLTNFRVKRKNRSANITITLHQAATSNTVIQWLQRADEEDSRNKYVVAMTIKDNSGQTLFFAEQAFVATVPNATLGTTAETRAWVFQAVSLDSFVGGNTQLDAAAVQVIESLGGEVESKWRV